MSRTVFPGGAARTGAPAYADRDKHVVPRIVATDLANFRNRDVALMCTAIDLTNGTFRGREMISAKDVSILNFPESATLATNNEIICYVDNALQLHYVASSMLTDDFDAGAYHKLVTHMQHPKLRALFE